MRFFLMCVSALAVLMLALTTSANAEMLLGHWSLDDNAADNVVIDSVAGHNGALYQTDGSGDNALNTENRSIPGVFGTALDMQGQVWAELSAHVASLKPTGDYTLSMWVKNVGGAISSPSGVDHNLFAWDVSDPYYPRMQYEVGNVGGLAPGQVASFFAHPDYTGGGYMATRAFTWVADQWHHVAWAVETIEGTRWLRIYQDGVPFPVGQVDGMFKLFGTGPATVPIPVPGDFSAIDQMHIGCTDLGSLNSRGYGNLPLDDIGLWDGALTETEINNVMNYGVANYAIPEPSLLVMLIGASALMLFRRR